jgi:hypothetical protein
MVRAELKEGAVSYGADGAGFLPGGPKCQDVHTIAAGIAYSGSNSVRLPGLGPDSDLRALSAFVARGTRQDREC